ncbi:MAG TPA: hypothetical protein VFL81_00185 [Candidatus Saccharimonadales bacterium]|nr:hypothetical protein [Candidatus Saccharimonadales bacterium]
MQKTNIETLNSFSLESLPDLDVVVLGSLELLADRQLPKIDASNFKRPLVVGSGNAEATGRIIFAESDAVFASESSFEDKLNNIADIDEVILVSASGGKHAPIIARKAAAAGKHVTLITNTPGSPASQALTPQQITEYLFPKNREPYTYNTSTYMSMIFGKTGEDSADIKRYIEDVADNLRLPDLAAFDKYYLIVPPQFSGIIRMLEVKFIELFGRNIARDVETSEYVRHATTVAPSNELFIAFGEPNDTWGQPANRFNVPLPDSADYGAMMAVGYYIIAQIQKAQPQYFKDNIVEYCDFISGVFGETITPIVDGS